MVGRSGAIAGLSTDAVNAGSVLRRFIFDFLNIVACEEREEKKVVIVHLYEVIKYLKS